jgi:Arc/MetJ family transcription regulator
MRTNIVLDIPLIEEAMALTGIKTRRELVQRAVADLVRRQKQHDLKKLKGTVEWIGDLDAMRELR